MATRKNKAEFVRNQAKVRVPKVAKLSGPEKARVFARWAGVHPNYRRVAVRAFCDTRLITRPTFHMKELTEYVVARLPSTAPDSPRRVFNDLRKKGVIAYELLSRTDSHYRLLPPGTPYTPKEPTGGSGEMPPPVSGVMPFTPIEVGALFGEIRHLVKLAKSGGYEPTARLQRLGQWMRKEGAQYVDIRPVGGADEDRIFASKGVLQKALKLFPKGAPP